jgi:peptidoglycan/xylan/chitin deacetylase (PgdA/CDA1 family)
VIFVTGDVHHQSLNTLDQAHLTDTEIESADKYAQIAGQHGVDVTLFVSGKTVQETPDQVRELAGRDNVEIGGHNWDCFEHSALHYLSELLLSTYYGPPRYQRWDVRKTLDIIELSTEFRPRTWRSHAFVEDDHTAEVLADIGIGVVSNAVAPERPIRRATSSCMSFRSIRTWSSTRACSKASRSPTTTRT